MRYVEIITEHSMSDVAYVMDQVRRLTVARADPDLDTMTVTLWFDLDGVHGSIRLAPRIAETPTATVKKFRARLYAAAVAVLRGRRPASWASAVGALRGTIHAQAVRILTNPREWRLVSLHFGDLNI